MGRKLLNRECRFCKCGCSITFMCLKSSTRKYLTGHYSRKNVVLSDEHKSKISFGNKGKRRSDECNRRNSEARKGISLKHKINCKCFICKAKRRETKHKLECLCCACRSKRGEYKKEKHPNWIDGKQDGLYGIEFNDSRKHLVRGKDLFCCSLCGVSQEENVKKLSVHHVDYNKRNSSFENLIALCKTCHAKTNGNRKEWKEVFNLLLGIPDEVIDENTSLCVNL